MLAELMAGENANLAMPIADMDQLGSKGRRGGMEVGSGVTLMGCERRRSAFTQQLYCQNSLIAAQTGAKPAKPSYLHQTYMGQHKKTTST